MANQNTIPVSSVVSVTVQGAGINLAQQNINTCALISSETPVNTSLVGSYAIYQGSSQVAADWGLGSKAFAMANQFFAQNPNPLTTQGYLVIIPRNTGTQATLVLQDLTYYAAATGTGGNSVTIAYTSGAVAGKEVVTVAGSAISVQIASGSSTAAQVQAAIAASVPASALVYTTISGTSTNPQVAVAATNLASGSSSGTESIIGAINRTMNTVYYYGILIDTDLHATSAILTQLTSYVQSIMKAFFYATASASDILTGGQLQLITAGANTRTRPLYYNDGTANDTLGYAAAYASRALSTNFNGSNTTQTMNLKTLAGVVPDATITPTLLNVAMQNGVDVYPAIGSPNNGYVQSSGANSFWDQVYGQDWFSFAVQTAVFNYLAGASTKIPQTEIGVTSLKNVIQQVCQQAVTNGWVARGTWTASIPFGDPQDLVRNIADFGYYIYSQPVSQQSTSARALRVAPPIQVALKMAGAVHTVVVSVQINL